MIMTNCRLITRKFHQRNAQTWCNRAWVYWCECKDLSIANYTSSCHITYNTLIQNVVRHKYYAFKQAGRTCRKGRAEEKHPWHVFPVLIQIDPWYSYNSQLLSLQIPWLDIWTKDQQSWGHKWNRMPRRIENLEKKFLPFPGKYYFNFRPPPLQSFSLHSPQI